MTSIPREFIDLLLTKIDLVDLVNAQIPLKKKSGSNYFACCPFHNEKSGSFSVSQTKQFYYCFGCGAHGNAIDFMMQHDRLSFPEAIEALAKQAGMEITYQQNSVKKDHSITILHDLMKDVSTYFYEQMRRSPHAIQYLKNRGISGAIAQQFCLGYAPNGWSHLLDNFGKTDINKKNLLDMGLIIRRDEGGYYDRFRDRIMFPIHDHRGRIIAFGGRILAQGEPKYLNSPETILFQKGHELYGLFHVIKMNRNIDRILVVEGYMDVLALFQQQITYAVATLGTATTVHHLKRLLRYTSEIIFCFDGDLAGQQAAWRALQVILPLMADNLQIRFLFLPENEDPDSLIRKIGKDKFEELIGDALSLSQVLFQTLSKQSDMTTMEGRARFASNAMLHIKQIPSGIYQEILLEELSKRARVDLIHLKQQLKSATPLEAAPVNMPSSQTPVKLPTALRLALSLLIQIPSILSQLSKPLPPDLLSKYSLLNELAELIKLQPTITTGGLIEYWRDKPEALIIAELAQFDHHIPENGVMNGFLDAIRLLTLLEFDNEINKLLARATNEHLSGEEKLKLADYISRKKSLSETDIASKS